MGYIGIEDAYKNFLIQVHKKSLFVYHRLFYEFIGCSLNGISFNEKRE